jgi:hypothetical protein
VGWHLRGIDTKMIHNRFWYPGESRYHLEVMSSRQVAVHLVSQYGGFTNHHHEKKSHWEGLLRYWNMIIYTHSSDQVLLLWLYACK